jgi:cysteinyl-tRNA synthetase
MITINGRKMGKSYNNVIRLSELFSGGHPILEQAYSPMTVRFFILQTHYRSTLDFGNEALQAAERGLRRLWDAFTHLEAMPEGTAGDASTVDAGLDARCAGLLAELDGFMADDLNTARVLANLFELVPVINSLKDGHLAMGALSVSTLGLMRKKFRTYLVDVFGLRGEKAADSSRLDQVLALLADIRKEARARKDFVTSDRIRQQLQTIGIQLKDEKDGGTSWTLSS